MAPFITHGLDMPDGFRYEVRRCPEGWEARRELSDTWSVADGIAAALLAASNEPPTPELTAVAQEFERLVREHA